MITHKDIKQKARENNTKISEYTALASQNDPFYIIKSQEIRAKWIYDIWIKEGSPKIHIRGFYYNIIDKNYKMPDGRKFLNTRICWQFLLDSFKYARFLGYIHYDDILDQYNPDPKIIALNEEIGGITLDYLFSEEIDINKVNDNEDDFIKDVIDSLASNFTVNFNSKALQPFYIEFWAEKFGVIPEYIANKFNATIRYGGGGEFSIDMCYQALMTAKEFRKPLFVFLLSDFDPKGIDMPKSVARKIEFIAKQFGITAYLKHIFLKLDQVIKYNLPSIPAQSPKGYGTGSKSYKTLTNQFYNAMDRQCTEINSFVSREKEAYDKDLQQEVTPYFDSKMTNKTSDLYEEVRDAIQDKIRVIIEANREEIIEKAKTYLSVKEEYDNYCEAKLEELGLSKLEYDYKESIKIDDNEILNEVTYDLPEPEFNSPDDDPDVMLNTNLDYYEQIELYKKFNIRYKNV